MDVTLGMLMEVICVFINALLPMVVTLAGRVIAVIALLKNVPPPMAVTPSGITTTPLQSESALLTVTTDPSVLIV